MDLPACTLPVFLCTSEGFSCLPTILLSTCLLFYLQGNYGFSRCWRVQFMWCLCCTSVLQLIWVTSGPTLQCLKPSVNPIGPIVSWGICFYMWHPAFPSCPRSVLKWICAELSSSRAVLSLHPWFMGPPTIWWLPAFPKSISCIDLAAVFWQTLLPLRNVFQDLLRYVKNSKTTTKKTTNKQTENTCINNLKWRFERPLFLCYSLSEGLNPSPSWYHVSSGTLVLCGRSECQPRSSLHSHSI